MICDVAVLGGGPGGTTAAFEAVRRGMKTVLVEMGFMGGTCLNSGCVPTKLLLGATASLDLLAAQKEYKTASGEVSFDLAAMQERKNSFIKSSRQSLEQQLVAAGVTVVRGRGSFSGPHNLSVKTKDGMEDIRFTHCVIATGSAPAFYPGLKPDGESILSSSSLMSLTHAPKSLIIVGGGAIGLELGSLFHRLGTQITLVEALPRIASVEDEETSAALADYLRHTGWTLITGKRVKSLATENGKSVLRFEDGETVHAEKSLVAVGRLFQVAQLLCEPTDINLEKRGNICTDAYLRACDNVYAVGDVNGRILLAHAAEHQARYALAHMTGEMTEPYACPAMPSCIYGHMEVMRVGPTAADLKTAGHSISVSRSFLIDNAICQSYGAPQGFIKITWVDATIRSITAFGHGVSHLLIPAQIMVAQNWTVNDINQVIFPRPTLDEALKSAILASQTLLE